MNMGAWQVSVSEGRKRKCALCLPTPNEKDRNREKQKNRGKKLKNRANANHTHSHHIVSHTVSQKVEQRGRIVGKRDGRPYNKDSYFVAGVAGPSGNLDNDIDLLSLLLVFCHPAAMPFPLFGMERVRKLFVLTVASHRSNAILWAAFVLRLRSYKI